MGHRYNIPHSCRSSSSVLGDMIVLVSGITSTGKWPSSAYTDSTMHTHTYASHVEVLQGTKFLASRHSDTKPKHLEEVKNYKDVERNKW